VLDAAKRSALEHGLDIVGVIAKPISRENLRLLEQFLSSYIHARCSGVR
jgi:hypothetical protein